MAPQDKTAELLCLLLGPIVRYCLRRSIKIQELIDAARILFLETAQAEVLARGQKESASRLSVITGVHRKFIPALLAKKLQNTLPRQNLLTRIVGHWQNDPRMRDKDGKTPRPLSCEGADNEFIQLVRKVSKDVNPFTMLAELERVQLIRKKGGTVELLTSEYVSGADPIEGFAIAARDFEALLAAVGQNTTGEAPPRHLHLSTEFDNIPREKQRVVSSWLLREGSKFQKRVQAFLAKFDRDVTPATQHTPGAVRVRVGTFSFLESLNQAEKK